MRGWIAALATLAKPVLARVLVALGMSVVTITGVDIAIGEVQGLIVQHLGQGPIAALQLAGLAGCWTALGMIFGAVSFALSYWMLTQATQVIGAGTGG